MAFILPHVLFPDSNFAAIQLLNFSPGQIISYQIRNQRFLLITILISYLIIAFFDPGGWDHEIIQKTTILFDGILFLAGIFSLSYYLYARVGIESQAWQEGLKGAKVRDFQKETGSVQVSPGSLPTFQTTIIITLAGMLSVVFGAYVSELIHFRIEWLPGIFLIIIGFSLIRKNASVFDRFFYQTHAFYSDFLSDSSGSETANRTATYQSIYWVPERWKPSAWAGIVQIDRYFPMGRIVFLGHFILWLLFYFGSAPFIRNSYLFLFVLLQNTSIYLLLNKRIGPVSWNYRIQKPTDWVLTRFFIQIRWLLPFILSLTLLVTFTDSFNFMDLMAWSIGFIFTDLFGSIIFTFSHEPQFLSQYA